VGKTSPEKKSELIKEARTIASTFKMEKGIRIKKHYLIYTKKTRLRDKCLVTREWVGKTNSGRFSVKNARYYTVDDES
jgi:hypothetical protein